jgi:outer membrane immunogenic protein
MLVWRCLSCLVLLSPLQAGAQDFAPRTDTGRRADFSGFGLGLDAGVGLGSAGQANTSGVVGGGHLGYNFQAQGVVGGAEVDVLTARIKSGTAAAMSYNQNFLSSARVKAGYVFGDLLAYGSIGRGYATTSYRDLSGSTNKTLKGTVFGAGVEYAVTRNVSVRAEYMRYGFDGQTYVTPSNATPLTSDTNLLRAGASVNF